MKEKKKMKDGISELAIRTKPHELGLHMYDTRKIPWPWYLYSKHYYEYDWLFGGYDPHHFNTFYNIPIALDGKIVLPYPAHIQYEYMNEGIPITGRDAHINMMTKQFLVLITISILLLIIITF